MEVYKKEDCSPVLVCVFFFSSSTFFFILFVYAINDACLMANWVNSQLISTHTDKAIRKGLETEQQQQQTGSHKKIYMIAIWLKILCNRRIGTLNLVVFRLLTKQDRNMLKCISCEWYIDNRVEKNRVSSEANEKRVIWRRWLHVVC